MSNRNKFSGITLFGIIFHSQLTSGESAGFVEDYLKVFVFDFGFFSGIPIEMSENNKVNMALDDIIKMNKKKTTKKGAVRNVKAGRQVAGRKIGAARGGSLVARRNPRIGGASGTINNAATKKFVKSLVKKALKRNMVQRAAISRPMTAVTRRGAFYVLSKFLCTSIPYWFESQTSALQGGHIGSLSLDGSVRSRIVAGAGLSRVSQRSRVIGGLTPLQRVPFPRVQRGRGFNQNVQTLYQDEIIERPVRVIRQQRPVVVQRVVAPRQQRVIQRVVQPRQRVIVQQPRQRVNTQRPRQRVIVVERPVQRQRLQKVIQRFRPQIVDRVERIGAPRFQRGPRFNQGEVIRYVGARQQKNTKFRNALGIVGSRTNRSQQVDRFEPSSSFIQAPGVVKRGRGFRNNF
uniref:Zonadhesin n=1 Tax=Heterorhabditis bacteriophora TaxID=37862 RepID=A0A1I7XFU9_HETBA